MATRDPDRRHKIIEAARRVFGRHGYDGASISMIASEIGLTKAALYHHFTSKEAIYRASSRTGMDELIEEVSSALNKAGPQPIDRLRAYMHASAARFERNKDSWMSGSAIFWSTQSSETRSEVVQVRDRYESLLKEIIQEGIASGVFRKDIDVNLSSKFLLSIINQLPRWYRKGGKYSAVEVIDTYLDTYLNGVLDRDGL